MDILLVVVFASLAGSALVGGVIVWSSNRAAHGAITRYFQASEFILEHHRPPPAWMTSGPRGWMRLFQSAKPATKAELITRLDELIAYFERCSFFEDEYAREQLLHKLREERDQWRDKRIV